MTKTHIVVGGGASGIFLAYQLLKDGNKVILLDRSFDQDESSGNIWSVEASQPNIEKLPTSALTGLHYRQLTYPHCYRLGGNSNINAMLHGIGHEMIFDKYWPPTWNSELIEELEREIDALVPVSVQSANLQLKTLFDMLSSDSDRTSQSVVSSFPAVAKDGKRWILSEILSTWKTSSNFTTIIGKVMKVVVERGVAQSIIYETEQQTIATIEPTDGGEIILCAGAFETPRILYDSIHHHNQENHLKNHDNYEEFVLQDHVVIPYFLFGNTPISPSSMLPINCAHGWIYTDDDGNIYDPTSASSPRCQILVMDGRVMPGLIDNVIPRWENLWWYRYLRVGLVCLLTTLASTRLVQWICSHAFFLNICIMQPRSRGKVSFQPQQQQKPSIPIIDNGFLTNENDLQVAYRSFLTAKSIVSQAKQTQNVSSIEILPGPLFAYGTSYSWFVCYARWFATTYFHPCGTCQMPSHHNDSQTSIVDDHLRVKGIERLRIADASVIPHIPTFPIAKLCMMIGLNLTRILKEEVEEVVVVIEVEEVEGKVEEEVAAPARSLPTPASTLADALLSSS